MIDDFLAFFFSSNHEKKTLLDLLESLETDREDWFLDNTYAINQKKNIKILIRDGILGLKIIEPFSMKFSARNRFYLWRGINDLKGHKISKNLRNKKDH